MQLLEHFKELTLHPKNAEGLKGLILQLAVQGKLTQKWRGDNPDVEPASVLLEKIENEKDEYTREKKIRKDKSQLLITNEDPPFDLPDSWEWSRMQNICYLITDGTHHTPRYIDNGIPFLSVKNLSQGGIDFSDTRFISLETHRELIKRCNPEFEDLLLTKIGTTGIAKVIDVRTDFSIFVSVALLKISKQNLFPYFIEYCINSPFIKKQSRDGTEGVGNKNLVLRKIKEFLIPIPPLAEQKAIVETVNQLFAEVEQLEALTKERIQLKADFVTSALNQLTQVAELDTASQWDFLKSQFGTFFTEKENIKKLRESILQLAVQGKLTHHWRAEQAALGIELEPASILLDKIKTEKAALIKAGEIRKSRSVDTIIMENCNWDKPEKWSEIELQDLFKFIDYRGKTATKSESGKRLITAKNIRMGYIKNDPIEFVSNQYYKKWMTRGLPKIGDILFVTEGHTMGFVAQIDLKYEFALAQRTICFQSFLEMDLGFYYFTMMSPQFQSIIIDNQTGSAAGGIKASKLKRVPIPIPPSEEQKVIVEKVNGLMDLCDQLEQEIENHKTTQEQWMQSCLREVV